ncbi:hypothetical protein JTB14_003680 [Gonioctena quinquepunctata]|nr:hypothetical protein JTB14_003680 [Gonioctena quinquepunctata]
MRNAIKSVREEELDLENNVVIRRTENKRKYRGKSPNTKGYLKAQDEINDLDKDISNAARIHTEKSVQEMKANHHEISAIPFSVLEQSYRESTYDYWVDKMARKYQGDRNILSNQIRILRDVPPSSPELVVKVAKEDFPALRPGRRHEQIPNPIKGKGKLINRPNIEISNRFGVLANEGTSEPDTEKEREAETNQKWVQAKGRRKGGNKAPNLTLNIAKIAGGPSSLRRKEKPPVETTHTETDEEKGGTGGSSSQNRKLKSPAKITNAETDGVRTKGNRVVPKRPAKQDTGIKNMPPHYCIVSNPENIMATTTDKDFENGEAFGKKLSHPSPSEEVVITGFSGTFAEARNAEELKEALLDKLDMSTAHYRPGFDHPELPKRSATINEGLDEFDCGFFGLTEHLSQKASIEVRLLLEKSIEAIMDAGLNPEDIHNTRTNVHIAFSLSEYECEIMKSIRSSPRGCIRSARTAIGMSIAHFLKIKGKVYITDTACSSSLHSIDHAYRDIRMGECENALVVTANISTLPKTTLGFALLGVLSEDGVCKPFDEHGYGYVRSEAASAILLQKAKNSKRIYAQLIHSKCNSDGFKEIGITFPSRQDQANVIEEVLIESNIDPEEVTFVEAHATGKQNWAVLR